MDEIKIYKLDEKKSYDCYNLNLVKRTDKVAMYAKYHKNDNYLVGYEVFKVMIGRVRGNLLNSQKYKGYTYYEIYPCNNNFGVFAWDICGKECSERAEKKYNELLNNVK